MSKYLGKVSTILVVVLFISNLLLIYIFRQQIVIKFINSRSVDIGTPKVMGKDFIYKFDMKYMYWDIGGVRINVNKTLKALWIPEPKSLNGEPIMFMPTKSAYGVVSINGVECGIIRVNADRVDFAVMKGYFLKDDYFQGKCVRNIEGEFND